MTFIDPTNDWAFKRIFGSRESGPVLVGFLNDLLHQGEQVIQSVKILDPYLPSQVKNLKNTVVDVRATLAGGREVLIEMQMFPVAGFCERVLYNGAKCLSSQLGRGSDYTRIRPVTVITVADCVLLPETNAWLSHYALQEKKTGAGWPTSGMEIIFIELPKADLSKLSASHPLHDWLEFLKNAPAWRNVPRAVTSHAVRDALRLARHDNLSPSESQTMTKQQLYREDQKNMLLYAQRAGMQQGMQQGMKHGDQTAAWRIARVSLAQGLSPELVATITGLTEKEVRSLLSPLPPTARVVRRRKKTA
ncbi:MAG: Rpn family recombination-promoting nuclease/putative transposase [Prosthecobacter sp.]|uniref:Rpn family recombination-promoting nuclease/putative transposase n=1 Tax=Prosthecobacter sp. TaxID=1965333 RepID=UPI0039033E38